MIETITPAGCGSSRRRDLAQALFLIGAVAASALLGALLGLAGSGLERDALIGAVVVLALLGAAREARLLRLPLPGLRRQVPERWRREWPLGAWSLGYGAGLGAGLLTHQTVATFWVAAAGALAIGDPLVSAACLAPFGLGRALMVALPGRRRGDPAEAVERMALRARRVGPLNAAALVGLAVLAGAPPALAQGPGPSGVADPSASGRIIAATVLDGRGGSTVVVRAPILPTARFPGARSPSVDGPYLAYADAAGIRVVRWTTGEELARIRGRVATPALDYPRLAYVRRVRRGSRLELRTLPRGPVEVVARAGRTADLGRPALRGSTIAWHIASGRRSLLLRRSVRRGSRRVVVASSVTGLQINPSIAAGRILWVEQIGSFSLLRLRGLTGGRTRTLVSLRGPSRILWTTALSPRRAYVTRWNPTTARGELIARRWR